MYAILANNELRENLLYIIINRRPTQTYADMVKADWL